jgi:hypothetical protein
MTTFSNLVCYGLFGAFVFYEITEESKDMYSSTDKDHSESKEFGDGYGKYIYWNKYKSGDTLQKLVDKTKKLGSQQLYLPTWRRSMVLAVLATIVIMVCIHRELLSFPKFFLYVILIFTIIYYSFNYYHYHYEKHAIKNLECNLDILEKKFKRRRINKNEQKNT